MFLHLELPSLRRQVTYSRNTDIFNHITTVYFQPHGQHGLFLSESIYALKVTFY
jgi:hypothetical protein